MSFPGATKYFQPLKNRNTILSQRTPDTEYTRACTWVGELHCATLSLKASPRAFPGGGPWDGHAKPPVARQERKGSCCNPALPAAWTTSPSVVVILELLGLAVSGSEVKRSESVIKQCETETVRTLTWRWKNSLKALRFYSPPNCLSSQQASGTFPCPGRGGQDGTSHWPQASLNRHYGSPNCLSCLAPLALQLSLESARWPLMAFFQTNWIVTAYLLLTPSLLQLQLYPKTTRPIMFALLHLIVAIILT